MKLLATLLALATTAFAGDFSGDAGLQLYSLRGMIKKDAQQKTDAASVAALLDATKDFGVTRVELAGTYELPAADLKKQLDARGLKAISTHFPYERYDKELPKVIIEDEHPVAATQIPQSLKYLGTLK